MVTVDPKDVVWAATSDTVTADDPIAEPMAAAFLAVDADEVVAEAPGRVAINGPIRPLGAEPKETPLEEARGTEGLDDRGALVLLFFSFIFIIFFLK